MMLAHRQEMAPRSAAGGAHSVYPGSIRLAYGRFVQCTGADLCFHRLMSTPDFAAATAFIAANARVIDRRRFERLFNGGNADPVRDAVAAYRNSDGGFGQGLEPDCRAPGSQPAAVEMALRIMDEAGAWDLDLVRGACDWLAAVAPAE